MDTQINIVKPVLRCANEEDVFHQRLSEITGVLKITMHESTVCVSASPQCKVEVVKQIAAICDIWHTTYMIVSD